MAVTCFFLSARSLKRRKASSNSSAERTIPSSANPRFSACRPECLPKTISESVKPISWACIISVSYTHLRAHETKANLVCRLLLEKKKKKKKNKKNKKKLNKIQKKNNKKLRSK